MQTPQDFIAVLCPLVGRALPAWENAIVTVGPLPTGSYCLVILEQLNDREYNLTLALDSRREQQMLLEVTVIGLTPDESGHCPVDRREWQRWTIQPTSRPQAFVHYVKQAIIAARQAVIDGTIQPY